MSRKLEVFEHSKLSIDKEITRAEFDALARFNERHKSLYFNLGHNHIKTTSYVGYIEVGDLSIEILPKADRDAPQGASLWRDGLLDMLRVAMGLRLEQHESAAQRVARNSLLDLIAQAYLAELEPLLREGLAKGYRTEQSNGSVFSGRLKIADHIRENSARADRFFVEYQTFDRDILVNQLLAAALHALSWCALSTGVVARVEESISRFPDVKAHGVTMAAFDRIRLTRATVRYEAALLYARMILAQQGPQLRHGRDRVFALLFDMNVLWEWYIAVLLRRAAPPGIRVATQESHDFSGRQRSVVTRGDCTSASRCRWESSTMAFGVPRVSRASSRCF